MSYGIEFLNDSGHRVIDEENYIMAVSEKNSIASGYLGTYGQGGITDINADTNGRWVKVEVTESNYRRTTNYYCTVELDKEYHTKPILAMRGKNGISSPLPRAYVYRTSSTKFNRIRFQSYSPISIDWILISSIDEAVGNASEIPEDDAYGLQIKNSNSNTIFDSRWQSLFSVRSIEKFPVLPTSHNYRTEGGPPSQSITIPSSPASFFSTDTLFGHHSVREFKYGGSFGEPILYLYGGEYFPSIEQVNDTTLNLSMSKAAEGEFYTVDEQSSGEVVSSTDTGGSFMVIRYLNF